MTTKTKAARHRCNDNRANVHQFKDKSIIAEFERGTLYGGLLIAVFFGLLMIHAAVML
jgi:hypothetical protein